MIRAAMLNWSVIIFGTLFAQSLSAINASRGQCCGTFSLSLYANIIYCCGLQHCNATKMRTKIKPS